MPVLVPFLAKPPATIFSVRLNRHTLGAVRRASMVTSPAIADRWSCPVS
jgi:hypothetical protein